MAPDPIVQERIYHALKSEIRSGVLGPDDHIDLQGISDRHRASVTPVREAVCRLIGEGLAAPQRHGGFRIVALDGAQLRDLYAFNAALLARSVAAASLDALIVACGAIVVPPEGATAVELAAATGDIFDSLSGASGSGELRRAVEACSDRLSAARITEDSVLRDVRGEILMFGHGPSHERRRSLSRRILHYHRRRIEQSDAIARDARTLHWRR
jgi:hypothetical protein